MKKRTWLILGATSIIAEQFAHLAAEAGHSVLLVGRNNEQLDLIKNDIELRYQVDCQLLYTDFSDDLNQLRDFLQNHPQEVDLFIAYSFICENKDITDKNIEELVRVNLLSTLRLINTYLQREQGESHLIFLSSVAACRGRAKNSLYGGSKAMIETYLEGVQQSAKTGLKITIARLGFIDTVQTFGQAGIFYASPPQTCAKACWQASKAGKRLIYHPFFWRYIMGLIQHLPFFLFKKMGDK